jgi:peptide/nickel transport system substrate-binding protein
VDSIASSPPPTSTESQGFNRRTFLRTSAVGVAAVGASGLLAACSSASPDTATGTKSSTQPTYGGTLTIALTAGSSADSLDPNRALTAPSQAYATNLYDSLAIYDRFGATQLYLAEEMTPNNNATEWTIRVQPGVTFHDGKPLTADDVMFSLATVVNPKDPGTMSVALGALNVNGMKKLDSRTVLVPFNSPFAALPEILAAYYTFVVPVGFDKNKPVGTGPFKYKQFAPGTQATFVRNRNYWKSPYPYVDTLSLVDFNDETSELNALTSGQINGMELSSMTYASQVHGGIVASASGGYVPFVMRVDQPPFTDVRVRQAFRLIADRSQMNELAFGGRGLVGNDVFGRFDPAYASSLPQREQDIAQAKYLLKQAGQENLSIELTTGDLAPGCIEQAQVFAQQAKSAGVTVSINSISTTEFYGPLFTKRTFTMDYWYGQSYLANASQTLLPGASIWETHWDDPQWLKIYAAAQAQTDTAKRYDLIHELMAIDYDRGGYIIPCFMPELDAHSANLEGVVPSRLGIPFNFYDFKSLWLS